MKKAFPTILSVSAKEQDSIYVSGGKLGMQIRIKPDDLCKAAHAAYGEVTVQ